MSEPKNKRGMSAESRSVDVLVVGGGIAGVFAAVGAKEPDISVVIVEPNNVLGGQGTAGGVSGFCGDTVRVNRPFRELLASMEKYGVIQSYEPNLDGRLYDVEHCAFFLQELVACRGIGILFHSRAAAARAQRGRVTSVIVSTASGLVQFRPRTVIDATGECVIGAAAGFKTMHEGPFKQLPMSLYFSLIDTGREVAPFLPPGCPTWESDEDIPMTSVYEFPSGKVEVKMKVVGYDAADGDSLSAGEMTARRQMMGLIYHLQTKGYRGKTYDRYVLCSVARQIGIREGRRIAGEHVLTEDEVRHGAVFEDAVAVGTYHLDYHWADRVQRAGTGITAMVEPYHIPLRSLTPKGSKNLLVPGRGASGDQMAMSSFRVMATCAQTGFATGRAALQCLKDRCLLPEIDVGRVQRALVAEGQSLDLSDYGEYLRKDIHVHEHIFGENQPFAQCHASSLVRLRNNKILAAWFGGTQEGDPDVAIWGACRRAGRWTAPRQIAKVRNSAHWNPVLFPAPDGRLHLFFKVGDKIPQWETWVMTSGDEGETWTEARALVPGDKGGRGPVKNKPIILSDGSWLAPASIECNGLWDVFVDRSEDGGRSWQASPFVPLDHNSFDGKGVIQPTLWESEPGHVHMLMRSTCGFVCRSDSEDHGRTWSSACTTAIPNNNSGIDMARLHDGALALVHNPVSGNWAARTPLSIALSFDNGETWPHRLDIEMGAGEYSYPSIIPTSVGMAITYTWKRQRIAFWMGSIERVACK